MNMNSIDSSVRIKTEPIDPEELEEKLTKTRDIILREFKREISSREEDIVTIQERIQTVQKYLKVLKYVAAYGYFQLNDEHKPSDSGDPIQEYAIHPCVQRLLPSKKEEEVQVDVEEEVIERRSEKPVEDKKNDPDKDLTLVRGTYKIRHKIVVGNVSKWLSSDKREDQATHKWMLYIRDKERDAELSLLVRKVRYFLHESYKPHDVIDVTSSPFHLTRRGWGEFPVRVKIFFKHPANKSIDVVHNLKLDYSCSGNQQLGGETLIETDLVHDNMSELIPKPSPLKQAPTKKQGIIDKEHDYCLSKAEGSADEQPKYQPQVVSSQPVLTGLEFSEEAILEEFKSGEHSDVVEWYCNNIVNRCSSILFPSTESCVKWFLMRWPIITYCAFNPLYKQTHPYAFKTLSEYSTSNIGKQRAAEWSRAFKIKKMLDRLGMKPWTTKQIMLYSRMYGYVMCSGMQYSVPVSARYKNFNTCTNSVDTSRDLRQLEHYADVENIDIVGDDIKKEKSPVKKCARVNIVSTWGMFVDNTARQIGLKFGEEEVVPDCTVNASSQMVVKATKCFLVDLLRKSLGNAWTRNSLRNPSFLEVGDIMKAIVENPEFDILTNNGLGAKTSLS